MTLQSRINQLVNCYDSPDFDPHADAADGATVGMVLLKDMRDALEQLSDMMCDLCQGQGVVSNPDARYYEEYADGRRTGQYSTNDPEQIDCPTCGGEGFKRRSYRDVEAAFPQIKDGELPF